MVESSCVGIVQIFRFDESADILCLKWHTDFGDCIAFSQVYLHSCPLRIKKKKSIRGEALLVTQILSVVRHISVTQECVFE